MEVCAFVHSLDAPNSLSPALAALLSRAVIATGTRARPLVTSAASAMKRDREDDAAARALREARAAAAEQRARAAAAGGGVAAAAAGRPPLPPPRPAPASPAATVILVSSEDDASDDDDPRPPPPPPPPPPRPPARPPFSDPLARTGFGLIACAGLPAPWNDGALGLALADLAPPGATFVWASNFMVDPAWTLASIPAVRAARERLIVCVGHCGRVPGGRVDWAAARAEVGELHADFEAGTTSPALNGDAITVAQPSVDAFGTHHTKALLLIYPAGCRFICLTGNFVPGEYGGGLTQGAWWQDFPRKDGASPCPEDGGFEEAFAAYAAALGGRGLPRRAAEDLAAEIGRHDWSSARADFIATVPGRHAGPDVARWGHGRLGAVLGAARVFDPALSRGGGGSSLIAQCSSLGSLAVATLDRLDVAWSGGVAADGEALGPPRLPLRIVWPTTENVRLSLGGWASGGSIPAQAQYTRAEGLRPRLCAWGGEPVGRSRAVAHMKSVARVAPSGACAWVVLGSHNLSQAAWGRVSVGKAALAYPRRLPASLYARSFEVSVALTPGREAAYRAHRHRGFCAVPAPPRSTLAAAGAGLPPPPPAAPGAAPPTVHFWAKGRAPGLRVGRGDGGGGDGGDPPAPAVEVVSLPLPYLVPPAPYGPGDIAWASDAPPRGVPDVHGQAFA